MSVSRRKFITSGLLLTTGAVLTDAFWLEKFFIEINEYYIGSATKESTKLRLVQISDLHLQSVNYQLIRLAKNLNELKPDLILITGDAIDKANNITVLSEFLELLDNTIQKVAILGNWEYWGNVDLIALNKTYNQHNCQLLVNQAVQYALNGSTITITGIDDYVGGNADFSAAAEQYKVSDYHVILNHCPEYNEQIIEKLNKNMQVDFVLSGHTHGGQINLFGFVPFLPQGSGRFLKGWYDVGSLKTYVSKGIGTSILPARFGARAEIAIFNL